MEGIQKKVVVDFIKVFNLCRNVVQVVTEAVRNAG
jgi:hypothetical protein